MKIQSKIQKVGFTVMLLIVLCGIAGSIGVVYAETYGDFEYSVINDGAEIEITGYNGSATELVIPSDIDGKVVTGIGEYAFEYCTGITSVSIPSSVTSIGYSAFSGCSGITGELEIPASVTSIGSYAFDECSGLTGELIIPSSVSSIGDSAFRGCSGLMKVTVAEGSLSYKSIDGILYDKEGKKLLYVPGGKKGKINIPEGVKTICEEAFRDCSGLTGDLVIPTSVTSIGSYAFSGCSGLTGDLVLPEGVTEIGYSAFSGCSGLTGELVIPEGVTEIGFCAFSGCSSLTNVSIPTSVTSIGSYAFSGCSSLTSVSIPTSVISIGGDAFDGCSGLTGELVIPEGVTSIGRYAFHGCSGLTSVSIPMSVTSIGESAFSGCSGLTSISIPTSVTSIGSDAFSTYNYSNRIVLTVVPGSYAETYAKEQDILFKYEGQLCVTIINWYGREASRQFVNPNERFAEPVPSRGRTGYSFLGFYIGKDKYDFSQPVTSDITLQEKWKINKIADSDNIPSVTSVTDTYYKTDMVYGGELGNALDTKNTLWAFNRRSTEKVSDSVEKYFANFVYGDDEEKTYWANYLVFNNNGNVSYYNKDSVSSEYKRSDVADYKIEYEKSYVKCTAKCTDGTVLNLYNYKQMSFEEKPDIGNITSAKYAYRDGKKVYYFVNDKHELFYCVRNEDGKIDWSSPKLIKTDALELIDNHCEDWDVDAAYINTNYEVFNIDLNRVVKDNVSYINCYDGTDIMYITTEGDLYIANCVYDKERNIMGAITEDTFANSVKMMGNVKYIQVQRDFALITRTDGSVWGYAPTGIAKLMDGKNNDIKETVSPSDKDDKIQPNEESVGKVEGLKQKKSRKNSITLIWNTIPDATGYEIYRRNYKSGKYKKIADINKAAKSTYTDNKLKSASLYQYKIKAYKIINGKVSYGDFSSVVSANTMLKQASALKVKSNKKRQVKITWKKAKGVTGYKIYRSTKKNGKYKKVATVSFRKAYWVDKKLKTGKKYYYKIQTYKKVKGKAIYSNYSKIKSVKVK